jgi:SAM-dependent methyltransferase
LASAFACWPVSSPERTFSATFGHSASFSAVSNAPIASPTPHFVSFANHSAGVRDPWCFQIGVSATRAAAFNFMPQIRFSIRDKRRTTSAASEPSSVDGSNDPAYADSSASIATNLAISTHYPGTSVRAIHIIVTVVILSLDVRARNGQHDGMVDAGGQGWRIERRTSFDQVAAGYGARPGYPAATFEIVQAVTGLGHGTEVLEIGAGNGLATAELVRLGAVVTAVEPGPEMAGVLQARLPEVEVMTGLFEEVVVPCAAFDVVVSATAFHWVDTQIGLRKAADALRDGGWLVLWWALYGDNSRPDPFETSLREVLEVKAPELVDEGGSAIHYGLDTSTRFAEIDATDAFAAPRHEVIAWEGHHSSAELRAMFATFSPFLALPAARREDLLDDVEFIARDQFGGHVTRPYQVALYLAQRRDR